MIDDPEALAERVIAAAMDTSSKIESYAARKKQGLIVGAYRAKLPMEAN